MITEQNITDLSSKIEELKAVKTDLLTENMQALQTYKDTLQSQLQSLEPTEKQIRLLKNVNGYQSIFYQEIIVKKATNDIVRYGDIFVSGGTATISGAGRTPINGSFQRVAIPSNVEVIDVVGGFGSFYAQVKNSNDIYVWGNNSQGCLGLGHTNIVPIPTKVQLPSIVKKICSKSYDSNNQFALILCEDGSIYGSGYNAHGQLGIGNTTNCATFTKVSIASRIKDVFTGNNYVSGCFAITTDNKLYAWGWNGNGSLGLGRSEEFVLMPEPITNIINPISVFNYCKLDTSWRGNSFILTQENILYGSGYNGQCQLNTSSKTDRSVFVEVLGSDIVSGFGDITSLEFMGGTAYCIMCLKINDRLLTWGNGNFGFGIKNDLTDQNIINTNLTGIKTFTKGCYTYEAVYALQEDGSIQSFGYNNFALGDGSATDSRVFKSIPTPLNIKDIQLTSVYETQRAFIATDGYTLYASGVSVGWNLPVTTSVLQPIARIS